MIRHSHDELHCYLKELEKFGRKIYPGFAIRFGEEWIIAVGDKFFKCDEHYAEIADFFLGRYYISPDLPLEFQKIIDYLSLVDKTASEKDVTKKLHALLLDSKIPCEYNLNSGADLVLYNGFYLCELKKVLPKNILTCIGQPVQYLNSYISSDSCLLLEIQTGRHYNITRIPPKSKSLFRYGMTLDEVTPELVELALRNGICEYCPKFQVEHKKIWVPGGYSYSLCICPVNDLIQEAYNKGTVKSLDFDWVYGFIEPSNGSYWKKTSRMLSDKDRKSIIDKS